MGKDKYKSNTNIAALTGLLSKFSMLKLDPARVITGKVLATEEPIPTGRVFKVITTTQYKHLVKYFYLNDQFYSVNIHVT